MIFKYTTFDFDFNDSIVKVTEKSGPKGSTAIYEKINGRKVICIE